MKIADLNGVLPNHQVPEAVTQLKSQLKVRFGGKSAAGVKKNNQDAFAVQHPNNHHALAYKGVTACIADGASCSKNSEHASQLSVTQFIMDYYATPDTWSVKQSASRVLRSLNDWLYHHSRLSELKHNGFVTTLSAVIIKSNRAHIFHVGDTRIYRLREGELSLLTRDHCHYSFHQEHFLTRALGMDSHLDIDYQVLNVRRNDVFVLTSDGVHQWLNELELADLLMTEEQNVELISNNILEHAMQKGSNDNLTCLLLAVTSLPLNDIEELNEKARHQVVPPVLSVGKFIDQFEVLEVLHSGCRSHVYLVKDNTKKQIFTLKAPSLHYQDDIQYLQSFMCEKWVELRVKSLHLMCIYPQQSRFLYHLCEYVEGDTLRQWMHEHPKPSVLEVRALLADMIICVRALQRLGGTHRDLKPENFVLNTQQKLVLIDYGAVKIDGIEEIECDITDTLPLGAIEYMSPEYLNTCNALHGSDIFSIGVMIYEMLTQHLPYQHARTVTIYQLPIKDWHYIPIQQYRPDIPFWIDTVIRKACHPDIHQRYQAMSELMTDFTKPSPTFVDRKGMIAFIEDNSISLWRMSTLFLLFILILQSLYAMSVLD